MRVRVLMALPVLLAASVILHAQPKLHMIGHGGMKPIQIDSIHGGYLPFEFRILIANEGNAPAYNASVFMRMPRDCVFADSSQTQRVYLPSPLPVLSPGDTACIVTWLFRGTQIYQSDRTVYFDYTIGGCDSSGTPLDSIQLLCSLRFPGLLPQVAIKIHAPDSLSVTGDGLNVEPNPFPILMSVRNTGFVKCRATQFGIVVPPPAGVWVDPNTPQNQRKIVDIPVQDSLDVSWLLHVENRETRRRLVITVFAYTDDTNVDSATDTVEIPAIRITGTHEQTTTFPASPYLLPNTPNPFRDMTRIRYSLPATVRTHLAVYDTFGRELSVLVDAEQAAGEHSVVFHAGSLPSGVYLYRLSTPSSSLSRSMLLAR
ncbi:MAG: T9SS type A sorting domain-containing protein [Ignavibacteriae bacterium]|nr:T9SS type A sorting domain-containing protein [Ignavibacteriota bacterium]